MLEGRGRSGSTPNRFQRVGSGVVTVSITMRLSLLIGPKEVVTM